MSTQEIIGRIEAGRIIAILRGDYQGREGEIVATLREAGITAAEVTLNSPNAIGAIQRLASEFGSELAIGAGTVLNREDVHRSADAGAAFIVSPNRNLGVIQTTKKRELVSIPGSFTPSEVIESLDAGADAVKLFPASSVGPGFISALRGPLSDVRLVPTGGIKSESIAEYLHAGAWAFGIGSQVIGPDALAPGGMQRLREKAAAFVSAVRGK